MSHEESSLYCAEVNQCASHMCSYHPLLSGSDSYLVEVGGPVLSLLGLSFIFQLFVCPALHCHTALANLPNELQELHNDKKQNDNKKQLLMGQFYANIILRSFPKTLKKTLPTHYAPDSTKVLMKKRKDMVIEDKGFSKWHGREHTAHLSVL